MSLLARCAECAKTYRVPHDREEWHCKQCQAVLTIDPPVEEEPTDGHDCPACGALAFGDEAFCEECGADLSVTAEEAASSRESDQRHAASEMRRAARHLDRLKTVLAVNFWWTFILLALLMPLLLLASDLAVNKKVLAAVLATIWIGVTWAGLKFVDTRPLPVVMTMAGLRTLDAMWSYSEGETWIGSAVWASLYWMLTIDAASLARLAKEFPELYLSRRLRGEHLSAAAGQRKPSAAAQKRALAREHERKAKRKRMVVVAGVLALLVAVPTLLQTLDANKSPGRADVFSNSRFASSTELPDPTEDIERFRVAWNAGDIPGMVAVTKASLKEKMARSLGSLGDRYDWGDRFPPLARAYWDPPSRGSLVVMYDSPEGEFQTQFVVEDGAWVLRSMKASTMRDWKPE